MFNLSNKILNIPFFIFLFSCNENNNVSECKKATPAVEQGTLFFEGVDHTYSISSKSNKPIAIVCHNCYSENSTETINIISAAIKASADIIELDIRINEKEEFIISHDINSEGGLLNDVIASENLSLSNKILYIELKDDFTSKELVRNFFNLLKEQKDNLGVYSYLNPSRFIVIRHANGYKTLSNFRDVLTESEFIDIQSFVKLSKIYFPNKEVSVEQAYECGFHMVEFDFRIGVSVIERLSEEALSFGLAINIFTLNEANFTKIISSLKHKVDTIVIEDGDNKNTELNELTLFEQTKQFIVSE